MTSFSLAAIYVEASRRSANVFLSCARNGMIPTDAVWASVSFTAAGVVPAPVKCVPLEMRNVPPYTYRPA